jgi:hypothetical protein
MEIGDESFELRMLPADLGVGQSIHPALGIEMQIRPLTASAKFICTSMNVQEPAQSI